MPDEFLRSSAVQVARQGNRADAAMNALLACATVYRISDQLVDADVLVDHPVDERRVCAVFEQAPHQVGEQRLVRCRPAHRCGTACRVVRADHLIVQRLTHAMQALEFVIGACIAAPC